jgi:predicted dehydrogenase
MSSRLSRRQFLQTSALATAGFVFAKGKGVARTYQANEKLNIGIIGVANQGRFSLENVRSQNIVALCDIDDDYLTATAKEFPDAKIYNDFRKLLEQKDIDAVTIATADHTHAPATMAALKTGRHVYCEKPLTHEVWEARKVAEEAKRRKRATQMGTQIHAGGNYRRVVEVIQSGAIGKIAEIHVWVGGGYSGGDRPTETPECPPNLHWDLWLGPAPERPYHPAYVPFRWRGWWDFGGGTLADMACHHIDLSHWALGLRHPLTVEAEGPPVHPESCPTWLVVHYEYPARGEMPPVKLTWYNGDKRPHYFDDGVLPPWGNGSLFVGEKGMLLADYDRYVLLPEKDFKDYTPPPKTIPDSIGHHNEWMQACKTGSPTLCNFDYAGALTETVLLGNVSYRTGKKIEWDTKHLRAKNCQEAEQFLRREYRRGWSL